MTQDDARSFEDLKTRLDEIVALVSDDSLPLDEALDLYEEAVGIGLSASRIMEEGDVYKRQPQYEAAADVEIETENRSIREVAEEVVAVLLDRGIMIDQGKA